MRLWSLLVLLSFVFTSSGWARELFVSPTGDDGAPGSMDKPLRSIQAAAGKMGPGDTCRVLAGVYRETVTIAKSGGAGRPIRFVAEPGVVLNGTDLITGSWTRHKGRIWKAKAPQPFRQLFVDGKMMIEARWPNMRFEQVWDRTKWAKSSTGSRKDLMICDRLAKTNVDWTGALATLNVGHQYKTWTRTVLEHKPGADRFTYDLAERLGDGRDDGRTWADDRFFLSGKLAALDAPTEWFHDADAGVLYLMTDDGESPESRDVAFKARDYGFDIDGQSYIEIVGFDFFATTFRLMNCDDCLVDDCHLRFPSFARDLTESYPPDTRKNGAGTLVRGSRNTVRRVSLQYTDAHGLVAVGQDNVFENCIVQDVNWLGSIHFPAIRIGPFNAKDPCRSVIRQCTARGVGNIGIGHRGGGNLVELNDVSQTGRACRDIAAIHTGSPATSGTIVRRNWVHGSNGIGIRGDDQTRGLTVDHNVVWDCARGIIVKGDLNHVIGNTVFNRGGDVAFLIPTRQEPQKWWTPNEILKVQNANSPHHNNVAGSLGYRDRPLPPSDAFTHNLDLKGKGWEGLFVDPENGDFRPKKGSRLIDAGRVVEGFTDGHAGTAPDLGAYEFGEDWRAGADWAPEDDGYELAVRIDSAEAPAHGVVLSQIMSVPIPKQLSASTISDEGKQALQALYDSLWSDDVLVKRRAAIQARQRADANSPEWKQHNDIVIKAHGDVRKHFTPKAPGVLNKEDAAVFRKVMKVK